MDAADQSYDLYCQIIDPNSGYCVEVKNETVAPIGMETDDNGDITIKVVPMLDDDLVPEDEEVWDEDDQDALIE